MYVHVCVLSFTLLPCLVIFVLYPEASCCCVPCRCVLMFAMVTGIEICSIVAALN